MYLRLLLLLLNGKQICLRCPSRQYLATSSTKIADEWSRLFLAVYTKKMLSTLSTQSSLYNEVLYAAFLHYSSFCWEIQRKMYYPVSLWRPFAISDSKMLSFYDVSFVIIIMCYSTRNFINIGLHFTEIWRYNDFQNGIRLPFLIFEV